MRRLYLTSSTTDELTCLDLLTDQVLWRKRYGRAPDSLAITPDGQHLYVPFTREGYWKVIRATDGEDLATIRMASAARWWNRVPRGLWRLFYFRTPVTTFPYFSIAEMGPHDTWMDPSGARVYLSVLTEPWVWVVDTATNTILGKVGPFTRGVRPFAVSEDEQYVYANVDGLLGFEVASVRDGPRWGGPLLHRVEQRPPDERAAQLAGSTYRNIHVTPSHGVNLRPDQREVWFVDDSHGYVYAYDVTSLPPAFVASVPLFDQPDERPHPGWISFSIDGRYAYPDGGAVIDTATKQVVARIPTTEKLIEIDFRDGRVTGAGHR